MRFVFSIIILALLILFSSFTNLNTSKYYVKTVVIDAGHGGKDAGAYYASIKEKDIALNISLKLGKYIKENLKDVKVIYTREDDRFIELWERSAIANRHNADVFISIHANAASDSRAQGTETYCMGPHKLDENLDVAKRENSVILLEENYEEHYDGFDPNDPESHIILSLYQNIHLERSLKLAEKIEDQFKKRVNRRSRGVKQAGFIVLWRSSMPSVLIETGFLSNDNDRNFLNSEQGQVYMASAIFRAFRDFKEELEASSN